MTNRNDPCWCGSGKKYKKCHFFDDLKAGKKPLRERPAAKKVPLKTPREIEGMRRAAAFNGELLDYIRPFVKAGVNTGEIDALVHEYTVGHGHKPACLGYRGYPKSVCTSINDVVCHGIPSARETIKDGDIINIDLTTIVDGFYGDSSETFMIGRVAEKTRRLVMVAAQALITGLIAIKPGRSNRMSFRRDVRWSSNSPVMASVRSSTSIFQCTTMSIPRPSMSSWNRA
jgi:methionyl aminopeptidase